jgi:hypothetical protein
MTHWHQSNEYRLQIILLTNFSAGLSVLHARKLIALELAAFQEVALPINCCIILGPMKRHRYVKSTYKKKKSTRLP